VILNTVNLGITELRVTAVAAIGVRMRNRLIRSTEEKTKLYFFMSNVCKQKITDEKIVDKPQKNVTSFQFVTRRTMQHRRVQLFAHQLFGQALLSRLQRRNLRMGLVEK
jgi:hypothetical protein